MTQHLKKSAPSQTAMNSLRSVSSDYDMEWTEATMLALAVRFIDSMKLGDAFHEHLIDATNGQESVSYDGTSGQDRKSYSDDQDRENYAVSSANEDDDEPGFFDVHVCRVGYGHLTLRIKADSAEDAKNKALDEAGNHSYSENNSDYTVEGVMRCDDDEVCRTCGTDYDGCGDGYDGECPSCADKTEAKRLRAKRKGSKSCCDNEQRTIDGGCKNCGAPSL